MPDLIEPNIISDVILVKLEPFTDQRGRFIETFRKEWFPSRTWEKIQGNRSDSKKGVLRGLHYHLNQADYWYLLSGTAQVCLYDLRASSSTHKTTQSIKLTDTEPTGLFIPPGVVHGFLALSDMTLTYLVDNYYDNTDEHGVAWDDPEIGMEWKVKEPILSERDRKNPKLAEIPKDKLPQ